MLSQAIAWPSLTAVRLNWSRFAFPVRHNWSRFAFSVRCICGCNHHLFQRHSRSAKYKCLGSISAVVAAL